LAERLDFTLTRRLRETVDRGGLTETDIRELTTKADGWARLLRAQIRRSEQRLGRLTADVESGVTELAGELRRLEILRPQLEQTESLALELETKAREIRTAWLLNQADAARPV
jgi:hypothetical protein